MPSFTIGNYRATSNKMPRVSKGCTSSTCDVLSFHSTTVVLSMGHGKETVWGVNSWGTCGIILHDWLLMSERKEDFIGYIASAIHY